MKTLEGPWQEWEPLDKGSSLTVGVFDGVHLGHRRLVEQLDHRLARTVLTFDPHPAEVLARASAPRLLTTIEERVEVLAMLGVAQVGVLDLTSIKALDPVEFVELVLVEKMDVKQFVTGDDFRFGRDRTGDVSLLDRLAERHGFELVVVEPVVDDGAPISSTRIRALLEEGRVGEGAELLGSWYRLSNIVVEGDRRGAGLGFPTLNLRPPPRKLVPAKGVYACFARVAGETMQSAVNVGVRPTFGGGELVIEAFLLDFDRSIYGEKATLEFVRYLRPEVAFDDVNDLVEQIGVDVDQTRRLLAAARPNVS